jgi:hypothetical protein
MALQGSYRVGEIDDVRVVTIEKKITEARKDFLQSLLEFNGYKVVLKEEKKKEGNPQLYTLGITDVTFNPTLAVFRRELKTKDGRFVTQDYWNQKTEETTPQYWKSK